MKLGWHFEKTRTLHGFKIPALEHFKGDEFSSVIREVIQNSLDAAKKRDDYCNPVKVCFEFKELESQNIKAFDGIVEHLKACYETAQRQEATKEPEKREASHFFKNALELTSESKKIKFLCIHDYNTKGLTGGLDDDEGAFAGLIFAEGLSQKENPGTGGSYGIGAAAPLAMARIRTLFYYTKIQNTNGELEERFIGRARLQGHRNSSDQRLSGIGFYGKTASDNPTLIDKEIPDWPKNWRQDITEDTGTSIFIPYTGLKEDELNQARISVIANYFYAIWSGKLEVTIGNVSINKNNVEALFESYKILFETENNRLNQDRIIKCFTAIETMKRPNHKGEEEIKGFGKIKWYLRVGDEFKRRVGVCRINGMFVTNKPPNMTKPSDFPNTKPFDMFVHTADRASSDLLLRYEPPAHNKLHSELIKGLPDEKEIRAAYKKFKQGIVNIINKHAEFSGEEMEPITEFRELFGQISNEDDGSSGKRERGNKLIIQNGPPKKTSGPTVVIENLPPKPGTGGSETTVKKKTYYANNLRVKHSNSTDNGAILYFDSPVSGDYYLKVSRVGLSENFPVKFISEGKEESEIPVVLYQNKRIKRDVTFLEEVKHNTLIVKLTAAGPSR